MNNMPGLYVSRLLMALLIFNGVNAYAASQCGDPFKSLGGTNPSDYTNAADSKHLKQVNDYHFDPFKDNSVYRYFINNMDYTLRHFPNHYPALYLVSKRERTERERIEKQGKYFDEPKSSAGFPATAECYFERAVRFRPNDPTVHMLYGIHLHLLGKLDQALQEYKKSEQIYPNNSELQYNLGLLYFDRKEYNLARQHAQKAYTMGYPLRGLQEKLARVNR